jgi:hypothetical protein
MPDPPDNQIVSSCWWCISRKRGAFALDNLPTEGSPPTNIGAMVSTTQLAIAARKLVMTQRRPQPSSC